MRVYPWEKVITAKDAVLLSDGYWEVTYVVTQKRSLNGEDWEEKSITFSNVSRDRAEAEAGSFETMMNYLASIEFNLFSESIEEEDDAEYFH